MSFEPMYPLNTAVLFIVFNRLETTRQVFQAIRKAKPPRLYVAADGARDGKVGEFEKVLEVRDFIIQNIDWPCTVKTLFRDENLGCKHAVSGAITWFFENEDQGIILEDDCLPSQSFFWFCEEMLNKFKHDDRVGQVSGFNFGFNMPDDKYDTFFSKYVLIWGWATWRRVWLKYDIEMSDFEEVLEYKLFDHYFGHNKSSQIANFRRVRFNEFDTWDYQWSFSRLINRQFTVVPRYNLIENLGFGVDATHTTGKNPHANLRAENFLPDGLKCPEYILEFSDFYKSIEKISLVKLMLRKLQSVLR